MKKVILIGDSIRMTYDKYVKEALTNVAEVCYPDENCRFAEYVLRYAHEWKEKGEWPEDADLVHWNAGLWDVLELFDDGPMTSLAYYTEAIARINKRLHLLFPKAKFVFATSTPVIEHLCRKDFARHNSIICEYNKAELKALEGSGTVINDLYSTLCGCPEEYYTDFVHPRTKEGIALLGNKVLSVICGELDIAAADVNIENFTPENYSKDNIGY